MSQKDIQTTVEADLEARDTFLQSNNRKLDRFDPSLQYVWWQKSFMCDVSNFLSALSSDHFCFPPYVIFQASNFSPVFAVFETCLSLSASHTLLNQSACFVAAHMCHYTSHVPTGIPFRVSICEPFSVRQCIFYIFIVVFLWSGLYYFWVRRFCLDERVNSVFIWLFCVVLATTGFKTCFARR